MAQERLVFPELKEPTILEPKEYEAVVHSYRDWLYRTIDERGGELVGRRFSAVLSAIEQIDGLPEVQRMLLMMSPGSPRVKLMEDISNLRSVLGEDFPPLRELEADLACIVAEVADHAMRMMGRTASDTETGGPILSDMLGASSFGQVAELYHFAAVLYVQCVDEIMQVTRDSEPTDLRRTMFALVDQLVSKHLRAMIRALVMDLAIALEQHDSSIRFDPHVTSLYDVLPMVVAHPEVREEVVTGEKVNMTIHLLGFFLEQTFNSAELAVGLFNNTTALALIIGDVTSARRACQLARQYAGDQVLPQLVRNTSFIEELDSKAEA